MSRKAPMGKPKHMLHVGFKVDRCAAETLRNHPSPRDIGTDKPVIISASSHRISEMGVLRMAGSLKALRPGGGGNIGGRVRLTLATAEDATKPIEFRLVSTEVRDD
ncbi:hypothetical protein E4U58_001255 [Claviceps cyperi]|nr:hypothetical protein E4U58_001255 [Claviceps cyperi]